MIYSLGRSRQRNLLGIELRAEDSAMYVALSACPRRGHLIYVGGIVTSLHIYATDIHFVDIGLGMGSPAVAAACCLEHQEKGKKLRLLPLLSLCLGVEPRFRRSAD